MSGKVSHEITWTKPDGTKTIVDYCCWGEIKERYKWGQKMQPGLYQLWEVLDDGFGSVTTALMQGIRVSG
jgi:hypothetical protein